MSGTEFICRGRDAVVAAVCPTDPGGSNHLASSSLSLDVEYLGEFYYRCDELIRLGGKTPARFRTAAGLARHESISTLRCYRLPKLSEVLPIFLRVTPLRPQGNRPTSTGEIMRKGQAPDYQSLCCFGLKTVFESGA